MCYLSFLLYLDTFTFWAFTFWFTRFPIAMLPPQESCDKLFFVPGTEKFLDVLQNIRCMTTNPSVQTSILPKIFSYGSMIPWDRQGWLITIFLPPKNGGDVICRTGYTQIVIHSLFLLLTLLILLVLGSVWLMCRSVYLSGLLMSHGTDSVRTRRATIEGKKSTGEQWSTAGDRN